MLVNKYKGLSKAGNSTHMPWFNKSGSVARLYLFIISVFTCYNLLVSFLQLMTLTDSAKTCLTQSVGSGILVSGTIQNPEMFKNRDAVKEIYKVFWLSAKAYTKLQPFDS